ncbi:MFS general substrate transporter, partial [Peniophora sp. CONT]
SSLAPVDGGFGAWSYLTSAFLIELFVWGFPVAFGSFLEAYLRDGRFGQQPNAASLLPLVGTLSSAIMYFSSPITYPLATRYGFHRQKAMWLGTLICWASLFGASYATTVTQLLLLQGILYSIGGSLLWPASMTYMPEWFVMRRGLANGVLDAGASAGGIILPLILPSIIRTHGIALSLRYISFAFLAGTVVCLPFLKPRIPERGVPVAPVRNAASKSWLRSSYWWTVVTFNTVQGFAWTIPLIYLPTYASELVNVSASGASLSLALLNGMSLMSRLMYGTLSDYISPLLLAGVSASTTAVITFTLWGVAGSTLPGVLAFGALFGILIGGWSSLWTGFIRPVSKDDRSLFMTLYGVLMFSRGLGNVLSTPISNALLTQGTVKLSVRALLAARTTGFEVANGRFNHIIVFTGACLVGTAVLSLAAWSRE